MVVKYIYCGGWILLKLMGVNYSHKKVDFENIAKIINTVEADIIKIVWVWITVIRN